VESRRPRNLLAHFKRVRGYTVEEGCPGIYTVTGDILPIQIINSRKLSEEENIWLKDLDNKLDVERINRITTEIGRKGRVAQTGAYADVVSRANVGTVEEAIGMSKSKKTLEQVLENAGWLAKWEAQGEVKGLKKGREQGLEKGRVQGASQALELIKGGKTPDEAMQILGLDNARK
jgi:hypothetical protein